MQLVTRQGDQRAVASLQACHLRGLAHGEPVLFRCSCVISSRFDPWTSGEEALTPIGTYPGRASSASEPNNGTIHSSLAGEHARNPLPQEVGREHLKAIGVRRMACPRSIPRWSARHPRFDCLDPSSRSALAAHACIHARCASRPMSGSTAHNSNLAPIAAARFIYSIDLFTEGSPRSLALELFDR